MSVNPGTKNKISSSLLSMFVKVAKLLNVNFFTNKEIEPLKHVRVNDLDKYYSKHDSLWRIAIHSVKNCALNPNELQKYISVPVTDQSF